MYLLYTIIKTSCVDTKNLQKLRPFANYNEGILGKAIMIFY